MKMYSWNTSRDLYERSKEAKQTAARGRVVDHIGQKVGDSFGTFLHEEHEGLSGDGFSSCEETKEENDSFMKRASSFGRQNYQSFCGVLLLKGAFLYLDMAERAC
ncbi:50S ribosomal protein L33 1 [Striga asiatica]|uniref:50S ribosomal protein L33 1 n=1 Tax=Striga asiatica TaxID=4170 RepID=A0A5A7NZT9_STRAF|nr:50S ribosomal protein L33 1 [Striga asiatica]